MEEIDKIREVLEIYRKIFEISPDGFLIVDKNARIIYINPTYCYHLDIDEKSALGKPVLEVVKNSDLESMIKERTKIIEKNVIWPVFLGQYKTKEKYVVVSRCLVFDKRNNVIGAVGQVKFINDTIKLATAIETANEEVKYYKEYIDQIVDRKYTFRSILGVSQKIEEIKKLAQMASSNDFTVCITGESGTGKELFANAIHYASARRHRPLIKINCAAIPDELFESELFGYSEGAFTGAKKGGKKGKIFLANGGTLFLDEIGDLPLNMQAKLLRVLQEREIEVLGGEKSIPIDIRVITATNKNLLDEVKNNHFRSDLYYRINVIQIRLPALRERPEDIMVYAEKFLQEINLEYNTHVGLSARAKKVLEEYSWPGNVRELRNIIERAYTLSGGNNLITENNLPVNMLDRNRLKSRSEGQSLGFMLGEFEKEIIADTLVKNSYNIRKTAMELDISRSTLYSKMAQYSIEKKDEVSFRKDSEI